MLPDYWMPVDFFELNIHGKIDTSKLPLPGESTPLNTTKAVFDSEITQKIASVWEAILGYQILSENDNFFETGGHSLKAIQLAFRLGEVFETTIPVNKIFESPTIKELAAYIHFVLELQVIRQTADDGTDMEEFIL